MLCVIGTHIAGSEIPRIWIEAGIVKEGVDDKVLNGSDCATGRENVTLEGAPVN